MSKVALESKRLVGDRYRRVLAIVQEIADHPGQGRAGLARRFCLSERQVQADLTLIRDQLCLPLVRLGGYRFVDEADGRAALTAQDIHLLAVLMGRALAGRGIGRERAADLLGKLARAFPPHLAPLADALLKAAAPGSRNDALAALGEAIVGEQSVRLDVEANTRGTYWDERSVLLRPEALVPILGRWFVIGEAIADERRTRMIDVTRLQAATPVTVEGQGQR